MSNALFDIGDHEGGSDAINKAIELMPRSAKVWNSVGSCSLYTQHEYSKAIERAIKKAIDLDPELAGAWVNVGMFSTPDVEIQSGH